MWRDDKADETTHDLGISNYGEFDKQNPRFSADRCSTRRIVRSHCNTEEVEPGKFVRKCEKTEQLFKECSGRPAEMVQSNKEYTEEDVTDEVVKGYNSLGSSDAGPFGFPGLRSDIDAMRPFSFPGLRSDIDAVEQSMLAGFSRFFEAAEEMRDSFFKAFGSPFMGDGESSSSSLRAGGRNIPIKGDPRTEASDRPTNSDFGNLDISGLARDV
ncbi:hypothetical protein RJ641_027886 [Dillenia turbinata]|uniref:Mal d 1-associated protein n=1 Tax=Dillenia turbinata TaxID=194707 RepID=A0AAN8ZII6_9MAGN